MKFWKYSSAGNDFVIFHENETPSKSKFKKICDRRFGIGADGVLIFHASKHYDFEMTYFNADGGEVEMCGNGARALCHFAKKIVGITKSSMIFKTATGIYEARFVDENTIKMKMTEIKRQNMNLDNLYPAHSHYIEVGVPHVVLIDFEYDKEVAAKNKI